MNVFILCTGRCGSMSFAEACKHISNYSASHESLTRALGTARFAYPENHIEVDNHLSWHLGELYKAFGDASYYVHLKRNRDAVARSYNQRYFVKGSLPEYYCEGIKMTSSTKLSSEERLEMTYDCIDTINNNIEHFIKDVKHSMTIEIEEINRDFPEFWKWIEAKGNIEEAMNEFSKVHNAKFNRTWNFWYRLNEYRRREIQHFKMLFHK